MNWEKGNWEILEMQFPNLQIPKFKIEINDKELFQNSLAEFDKKQILFRHKYYRACHWFSSGHHDPAMGSK
jgi:hypothetical protein